jgi:hypothetical protein
MWSDTFHTGYVLECLCTYRQHSGDGSVDAALRRGWAYYRERFFTSDMTPKYYDRRAEPLDATACAQAIITLCDFRDAVGAAGLRTARSKRCMRLMALMRISADGPARSASRFSGGRLLGCTARWLRSTRCLPACRLDTDVEHTSHCCATVDAETELRLYKLREASAAPSRAQTKVAHSQFWTAPHITRRYDARVRARRRRAPFAIGIVEDR